MAKISLKTVTLSECEVKCRWKYPRFEIVSIDLTGEEKVALRGSLAVTDSILIPLQANTMNTRGTMG